jgi:stage II sporulation protein D
MARTGRDLSLPGSIRVARPQAPAWPLTVPFEEYVAAALTAEAAGMDEPAALDAQAVASRTYGLHAVRHPRAGTHDVWAGSLDQAVDFQADLTEPIRAALARTEGQVLVSRAPLRGQQPVRALFHHSCGGHTELPRTVWPRERLRGHGSVVCAGCQRAPFLWTRAFPAAELLAAVDLPASVTAVRLEAVQRSAGGRLTRLRIGAGGRSAEISADRLRAALGYRRLPSTWFDWDVTDGDQPAAGVQLAGRGSGHGVGLCQSGARAMALEGASHRQILAHYYPGAELLGA